MPKTTFLSIIHLLYTTIAPILQRHIGKIYLKKYRPISKPAPFNGIGVPPMTHYNQIAFSRKAFLSCEGTSHWVGGTTQS
jgi:hypothetical protein